MNCSTAAIFTERSDSAFALGNKNIKINNEKKTVWHNFIFNVIKKYTKPIPFCCTLRTGSLKANDSTIYPLAIDWLFIRTGLKKRKKNISSFFMS